MKRAERDAVAELAATNAEVKKLLNQYRNPGADIIPLDIYRNAPAFHKSAAPFEKSEAQAIEELRKGLASGEFQNWTPDDFDTLIKELAKDYARPNETAAQAYARVITQHPAGRLMYKGYRAAALGGTFAKETFDAPRDFQKAVAEQTGEAHARMHALAVDSQRARGGSYEQAYARVYGDNKNQTLRNKVKAEHLAATLRGVGDTAYNSTHST